MSVIGGSTAKPSELYRPEDIEDWLSARTVAKGRDYLDAISGLSVAPDRLTARVQGTAPKPYSVSIQLAANGRNLPKQSCSCPLGGYCKHVAAVLLKGIESRGKDEGVSAAALAWIERLRKGGDGPAAVKSKAPTQRLQWVIGWSDWQQDFRIGCLKVRLDKEGRLAGTPERWSNFERALVEPFKFVGDDDLAILRLLWAQRGRERSQDALPVAGRHDAEILTRLLDTGRFHMEHDRRLIALRAGAPRAARVAWKTDDTGRIVPAVAAEPGITFTLPTTPLWYLDSERGEAGPLQFEVPESVVRTVLAAPPLTAADARLAASVLADLAPEIPSPVEGAARLRVIETAPVPVLTLNSAAAYAVWWRGYKEPYGQRQFDYAVPAFRYGEVFCASNDAREFVTLESGETVRVRRRIENEDRALREMREHGLQKVPEQAVHSHQRLPSLMYGLESERAWEGFMARALPRLRETGWEIAIPAEFRHHVLEVETWEAEVSEREPGWFDVDMGIVVEGRRLALAPLLSGLFARDARWLDPKKLERISGKEAVLLQLPEGARIRVPAERLKPLARTLIDLFDGTPTGPLRVSRYDAPRLRELADLKRWQFKGMDAVQEMAEKLSRSRGVAPVKPPRGFALELRPYQKEGLAWLQYLRAHELSGILADDMGLGKTAQALAHLLTEKNARRLDRPALVVLPTSLVFNWQREAERFAPGLRILSLHGKDRHARFARMGECDVALTTYPLLRRDHAELEKHEYHLLILDEAQTVKNAASQTAGAVRRLRARHRLCLTGTPLENHIGELWAQFDFLLPGFLGDSKSFTARWRTPIEKHGNALRRELLAARVKPFILRRKKEDVAKELPPKSIILRTVELEGGQRDLYETVRSAMDEKVHAAIASQGFNRSQIVILDALLKLRQVCCDPRLLKSQGAKSVKERAKLDFLMGMLPELVEEGRRVLVFSQFTSMLALIETELDVAGIPYVLLTGDTRDRETPIRRFQDGEVPVFLVSLKAGGLGLNLTAADTVVHYDPWWNPAVENQATDRAHRIGQTKPVFVYKLVVAGSIEERILGLQEKKAALAAGILSDDRAGDLKFSETDLKALFAPLPPAK